MSKKERIKRYPKRIQKYKQNKTFQNNKKQILPTIKWRKHKEFGAITLTKKLTKHLISDF